MKLKKHIVLTALFAAGLMLSGAAVRAQDASTPPAGNPAAGGGTVRAHGLNFENIAKSLGLTDDQKAQFKAVFQAQQQKLKALMSDQTLSKDDRRAQAKQLREDLNTQLKGILTDDQFAKWQHMMLHHHPGQRAPRGVVPATPTNAPAASN